MIYILFLTSVACIYVMVRNNQVFTFRGLLIRKISEMAQLDIRTYQSFHWRYEKFREVSYEKMVFSFWKPLIPEAFYDDISFLENPHE